MRIKEYFKDIVFFAAILFIIGTTSICRVDGLSMYPTLDNNDVLILWKTKNVDYGDVVVVKNEGQLLVKRVIAKNGDKIEVSGAQVRVNDSLIKEAYAYYDDSENSLSDISCDVPEQSVFVMGDNRKESYDSRKIGPISCDLIVGRVLVDVTAWTGLKEKQFHVVLRVVSATCIILLVISVVKRKRVAKALNVETPGKRCNQYVDIGGDNGAYIQDQSEHD